MADLRTYLDKAERGTAARIARALKVHPVMLSQWASGEKAISEDQAPSLEWETGFEVLCETSCPKPKNGRWVRVPDVDWPNGKPLLDKTPASAESIHTPPAPAAAREEPAPAAAGKPEHPGELHRRASDTNGDPLKKLSNATADALAKALGLQNRKSDKPTGGPSRNTDKRSPCERGGC